MKLSVCDRSWEPGGMTVGFRRQRLLSTAAGLISVLASAVVVGPSLGFAPPTPTAVTRSVNYFPLTHGDPFFRTAAPSSSLSLLRTSDSKTESSSRHDIQSPHFHQNSSNSKNERQWFSSSTLAIVVSLSVLVQLSLLIPPPSAEASSYGQFSNQVNPTKIAPIVGRDRAKNKLRETCQRVGGARRGGGGLLSSSNRALAKRCAPVVVIDEEDVESSSNNLDRSSREVEHQRLLDDLSKEPDWFNYAAALTASVVSTLVIHPLDTMKVRLMAKSSSNSLEDDEEEDGNNTVEQVEIIKSGNKIMSSAAGGGSSANIINVSKPLGAVVSVVRGSSIDMKQVSSSSSGSKQISSSSSSGSIVPFLYPPSSTTSSARESSTALASAATSTATYDKLSLTTTVEEKEKKDDLFTTVRSLYDGVVPNIVKEGPPSALYLGLYESCIVLLKRNEFFVEHNLLMYLLAGAIGELVGSIVRAPAEAVKTRVQTGHTLTEAVQIVFFTKEGRLNTYRAWSSSLFRDVPMGAIQIAIFEALKLFLISTPYIDVDVDTLFSESLLGGIGGGIGAFLTTPSDRITIAIISTKDEEELSIVGEVQRIWTEEGLKGFFVGWSERTSYWVFAVGIFLSVYCAIRQSAIPLFVT